MGVASRQLVARAAAPAHSLFSFMATWIAFNALNSLAFPRATTDKAQVKSFANWTPARQVHAEAIAKPEYRAAVEAMWLILQQEQPDDYVIATGKAHSVARVLRAGVPAGWLRARVARLRAREEGLRRKNGRVLGEIDPRYLRPAEVEHLQDDASKAREKLGWKPTVGFDDLVELMVGADVEVAGREARAAEVSR